MAKISKTQLANQKREEVLALFLEFLSERGEDVMRAGGNSLTYPSIDGAGNEIFVKIAVSIPRGDRSGEAYDGSEEAAAYKEHQEEVAANKAQREKEKAEAAKKRAERAAALKAKKEAEAAAKAAKATEKEAEE